MPTVIDAFAVELGLDATKFQKGQRDASAAFKKTREAAVAEGKGIEAASQKAADSIDRIARNVLKLYALFTAGREIKQFVTDITGADAALGRLSRSLGTAPEVISAVANAVERSGGSAAAAGQSFQSFSDHIQELKATGDTSILPFLNRLQAAGGRQINLNKALGDTFADIADNLKAIQDKQGSATANWYGRQLGLDQGTVALLVQGGAAFKAAVAQSERFGIATKKDTEAAQALQTSITTLRQESESLGRSIMTTVTPTIVDLLKQLQEWIAANKEWIQTEIVDRIREFANYLKSIDWKSVGEGIKSFVSGADTAAQAVGGWLKVCEALFALWLGAKFLGVLRAVGLLRGLLVGGGAAGGAARGGGLLGGILGALGIGAVATGHGYQTPAEAAANPDSADLNREGIDRRARVRGYVGDIFKPDAGDKRSLWQRIAPESLGGKARSDASGGMRGRTDRTGRIHALAQGENGKAIIEELKAGGYNDNAIAAVMGSMQTESSLNPGARNEVNGGHTGLWQWDKNRWPKVKSWIESQGGNPMDARWQAKAWMAEHNAKPGDAIYDGAQTSRGGAILKGNPSLEEAVGGVRMSERFGPGEEGGRAERAKKWLAQMKDGEAAAGDVAGSGGVGGVEQRQQNATRSQPITAALKSQLAAASRNAGVNAEIFSGGQESSGPRRAGSHRHDNGRSADLKLYRVGPDGKRQYLRHDNEADRAVMETFLRESVKAGANGIGAGPGYMGPDRMHVGGGSEAAWGAGGSTANAPDWVARAHREGIAARRQPQAGLMRGVPNAGVYANQTRQAHAALSTNINDNRASSTTTNTTHISGGIQVQTAATDASGIARDIEPAIKRRNFALAAQSGPA